eukprot:scaffold1085_cov407-Prasinococcus_capsulatus_cf.AAC.2
MLVPIPRLAGERALASRAVADGVGAAAYFTAFCAARHNKGADELHRAAHVAPGRRTERGRARRALAGLPSRPRHVQQAHHLRAIAGAHLEGALARLHHDRSVRIAASGVRHASGEAPAWPCQVVLVPAYLLGVDAHIDPRRAQHLLQLCCPRLERTSALTSLYGHLRWPSTGSTPSRRRCQT